MNTHDMIELPPLPQGYCANEIRPNYAGQIFLESHIKAYARDAIEADRKSTEKQLAAYSRLVNSLEARFAHLQAQHDELKKSTNPDLLASERAANAMLTEELEAIRQRRGISNECVPVAVIRFERNKPGNENEMPKVISCNRLPDGDYQVFLAPQSAGPVGMPINASQAEKDAYIKGFCYGRRYTLGTISDGGMYPRNEEMRRCDE